MVCQVIAAAPLLSHVDEVPEGLLRPLDAVARVHDMEVEDDARIWLLRPGEKTLVVLLDEANGAVHDWNAVCAKEGRDLSHERRQRGARHVDLGNHFRRAILHAELL